MVSSMGLQLQKGAYHWVLTSAHLTWVFHKAIILPLRQQVPYQYSHITGNHTTCSPLHLTASCSETEGNHLINRAAGKMQSFHPACVVKIEILLQIILKQYKKVSPVSYAYTLLTDLFAHLNLKTKFSKFDYLNSTFMFLWHAKVIRK